jgi:4-amino-4-deoxy-L-arabinose transferase-like glycosyltransferase
MPPRIRGIFTYFVKPALRQYLDHIIIVVLGALCYVFFFHDLGSIGLIGPDEPRYAAIAREMLMNGDYITPRLYGMPWFEKPPLMYWFAALAYKLFGINEFAARFPSALGATISVFAVYWCGRKLWDRSVGFLAALILASSVGFFAFARAASMDMPLTVCLTLAMVFFLFAFNDQTPRRKFWLYGFYAVLGLGVLAKGPVAVLLPALSLCGFNLLRGKWEDWRTWNIKLLWITAAIAAPWYLLCTFFNGWPFIQEFFINQNFERFTSTMHGHDRPIYFFFPVLLLLTFPWTFLLISAMRRRLGKNEQLLVWWAIVPFVFFSLSGSKLPGYILPMAPPLAFLCAKELLQPLSRTYKVAVFIEAGTIAFIGVAFGFFGNTLNVDPHVSGMLIFTITLVMAGLLCVMALWLKPAWLAVFNVAAITALVITATTMVFPRFDLTDTMRPWQQPLAQIAPGDQTVFMYKPARWVEYGLQYYRLNHVRGVFSQEELAEVIRNEPRVLCIADDKALAEVSHVTTLDVEVVHTIGNESAFWVWQTK